MLFFFSNRLTSLGDIYRFRVRLTAGQRRRTDGRMSRKSGPKPRVSKVQGTTKRTLAFTYSPTAHLRQTLKRLCKPSLPIDHQAAGALELRDEVRARGLTLSQLRKLMRERRLPDLYPHEFAIWASSIVPEGYELLSEEQCEALCSDYDRFHEAFLEVADRGANLLPMKYMIQRLCKRRGFHNPYVAVALYQQEHTAAQAAAERFYEETDECPVCFADPKDETCSWRVFACGHRLCTTCSDSWVAAAPLPLCVVCRKPLEQPPTEDDRGNTSQRIETDSHDYPRYDGSDNGWTRHEIFERVCESLGWSA